MLIVGVSVLLSDVLNVAKLINRNLSGGKDLVNSCCRLEIKSVVIPGPIFVCIGLVSTEVNPALLKFFETRLTGLLTPRRLSGIDVRWLPALACTFETVLVAIRVVTLLTISLSTLSLTPRLRAFN